MPSPTYLHTQTLEIASAVAALPFPPVFVASVADWNSETGVVPVFDIEIWADGVADLTGTILYGISLVPGIVAQDTVTSITNATDNIEATTHGMLLGQGPIQFTGDDLPAGLTADTDYWVIYVDADNFQVATSLEYAIEGTQVALTDDGSGTMTFVGATADEIRYQSYGDLGKAADGVVALSAVIGYVTRINHRPRTVAYAISATVSASNISSTITPVRDK